MNSMRAVDFFGGEAKFRETLVDLIKHVRIEKGITPDELYNASLLESAGYSPGIIQDIEARRKPIDGDLALCCFSALGVPFDRNMPIKLTPDQKDYWTRRFKNSGQGPVCGTALTDEDELKIAIGDEEEVRGKHLSGLQMEPEIALDLFIRLTAYEEIK